MKHFKIKFHYTYIYIMFIFILIGFNLLLLHINLKNEKQLNTNGNHSLIDLELEFQVQEGNMINKDVQLINIDSNIYQVDDILENGPKLILFYNEKCCFPCIKETVKELEKLTSFYKYTENNLIIISDDYNSYISHNLKSNFKTYRIFKENLGINDEYIDVPILFIIKENHTAKMFFFPSLYNQNSLEIYLKLIEANFFLDTNGVLAP